MSYGSGGETDMDRENQCLKSVIQKLGNSRQLFQEIRYAYIRLFHSFQQQKGRGTLYPDLIGGDENMFDTGNTAFMIVATSLVMLMTPGLAFLWRAWRQ